MAPEITISSEDDQGRIRTVSFGTTIEIEVSNLRLQKVSRVFLFVIRSAYSLQWEFQHLCFELLINMLLFESSSHNMYVLRNMTFQTLCQTFNQIFVAENECYHFISLRNELLCCTLQSWNNFFTMSFLFDAE